LAFQSWGTDHRVIFDAVKFFAKPRFLRVHIFLGPKQNLKADFINRPSLFLSLYIYTRIDGTVIAPLANPYQRTSNADQLAIFLLTMPHCANRIGPNHRRSRHWCRQTSEVTRHFRETPTLQHEVSRQTQSYNTQMYGANPRTNYNSDSVLFP